MLRDKGGAASEDATDAVLPVSKCEFLEVVESRFAF